GWCKCASGERARAATGVLRRRAGKRRQPGPAANKLPAPPGKAAAAAPTPSDSGPGLLVRALLADGNEPVDWPLKWTVSPVGQTGAPPAFQGRAVNPSLALAPG